MVASGFSIWGAGSCELLKEGLYRVWGFGVLNSLKGGFYRAICVYIYIRDYYRGYEEGY